MNHGHSRAEEPKVEESRDMERAKPQEARKLASGCVLACALLCSAMLIAAPQSWLAS